MKNSLFLRAAFGGLFPLCGLAFFAVPAMAQTQISSPILPPESAYVRAQGDHLVVNGQKQRYWAAIGKLFITPEFKPGDTPEIRTQKVADARKGTDALLDRFEALGFNAFRLWRVTTNPNYTPGDGSGSDMVNYFVAQAGKRGFKIWVAGLNGVGDVKPEDANIAGDAGSADAWRAAVLEAQGANKGTWTMRNNLARIWDERIEALAIRDMSRIATATNKYNGLRWADDPTFGVWELSNEEWWMRKMVGGQWQKLPAYFRNSLVQKWNGFLKQKYGNDEALKTAWKGLLSGESLAQNSVLFAPMAGNTPSAATLNDSNEVAKAALANLPQTLSRQDFAAQRGSDVLEFLMGLQLRHKQRERDALKPLGRSLSLSPMIFDTGIGYEIQSQFLHQNADAVAHDAYVNGWGPEYKEPDLSGDLSEHQKNLKRLDAERISANDGRWVNWLLKPPGISQGVPWLEQNRVAGKPYLAYETQIQQPAKFRADFPLRLAALASIQDWSWICWHYFASGDDVGLNPRAFEKPMDVTTTSHPQGYHYTYDETQNSTMRAASQIFRGNLLPPAPRPTTFIYGRKSLYNPDSMTYAGSYGRTGLDMLQTTYGYGVRLQIDPTREDDKVVGPVVSFDKRNEFNPYRPTRQIEFDWKRGFLRFDAPGAKSWTGLLARYGDEVKFRDGVKLENIQIVNAPGMFDPITADEKYIAFSLQSADGKPLSEAKAASLSLVSTSYNTDFRLNEPGAKNFSEQGRLPVLSARVGATLHAKALNGMHYVFRDWNGQQIGAGVVSGGKLQIPANLPIWVVDFRR